MPLRYEKNERIDSNTKIITKVVKYIYTALKKETTFVAMYQQQLFFLQFLFFCFVFTMSILYTHSISLNILHFCSL